ncbi:hypothetical protein KCP75_01295 [Salmonella enterica subsp. enterica]|nr:hypothetical protein KCP75_01295 [Salmonella enterica subsp. enterica]
MSTVRQEPPAVGASCKILQPVASIPWRCDHFPRRRPVRRQMPITGRCCFAIDATPIGAFPPAVCELDSPFR